jgi:uncharacterized protein (TIGR02246 family)
MIPDKEKDEAAVREWIETYINAVKTGDLETYYNSWTDDIVMLPPNRAPIHGIDALKELVGPAFDRFDTTVKISDIEIGTDSSLAYLLIMASDERVPKEGGEVVKHENKCLWLLRRQPDNSWKASHCIFSPNHPPDEHPAYGYEE